MTTARRHYAPRLPPAERRTQLLDAALDLIDRDGYGAVTMEAVAAEVGVAKPVVYGVFANRGDLLWALLEREERLAMAELSRLLPSPPRGDGPAADQLVDSFVAVLEAVRANPRAWRVILEPTHGAAGEIVDRQVAKGRAWLVERIAEILRWTVQQRAGAADLDLDLDIGARALLTLGEAAARLVLASPEEYPPRRLGDFARVALAWTER